MEGLLLIIVLVGILFGDTTGDQRGLTVRILFNPYNILGADRKLFRLPHIHALPVVER